MKETEIKKLRKAYFSGSLDKYLDKLQAADEVTTEQLTKIEAELEKMAKEKEGVRQQLGRKYKVTSDEDIKPPSVEDLQGNVNKEELEAWHNKVKKDVEYARQIISATSTAANKKAINIDALKDILFEIVALRNSIDQDRVYKDQLYRAKLTTIIDDYGVSRAEAEERAKLTKEYRDYKLAVLFTETVNEFINVSKKKIGNQY